LERIRPNPRDSAHAERVELAFEADDDHDERAIVEHVNGNVCRCGTYPRIVRAIRRAAAALKGGAK
jgi:aerobic-type carbon monoxide dehydrogenase small subunit (CoxS/CutS family)